MDDYPVVDVKSSVINKVGYDYNSEDLFIEFKNGKHYLYHDVPEHEFEAIQNAESVGKYFIEEIRDEYDFTDITTKK